MDIVFLIHHSTCFIHVRVVLQCNFDFVSQKADLNSHKTLHVIFFVCTTLVNEYTGEFNSDVSTTILNTIR